MPQRNNKNNPDLSSNHHPRMRYGEAVSPDSVTERKPGCTDSSETPREYDYEDPEELNRSVDYNSPRTSRR